jgi:hypothetical protein
MSGGQCSVCQSELPRGRRRYCVVCAPLGLNNAARDRMRRLRAARGIHKSRLRPPTPPGPGEKWCPHCQTTKPQADFARSSQAGFQSWCRVCKAAYAQQPQKEKDKEELACPPY